MHPLLEVRGVGKSYESSAGPVHALRNVDLSVTRGEFVAIMGSSGCGKSTLLHLVAGLDRPTSGEVMIDGQRIDTLNEAGRALVRRRQIGFVFQFFNLIGNLDVAENVELPALLVGLAASEARKRREALLAELGLESKARNFPAQLSGGEQQRVAVARALVNHPSLLIADEPTGNLSSEGAADVMNLFRRHHAEGQTILLVSHDARVAAAADRVVYLRDGQVQLEARMEKAHDARSVLSRVMQLET